MGDSPPAYSFTTQPRRTGSPRVHFWPLCHQLKKRRHLSSRSSHHMAPSLPLAQTRGRALVKLRPKPGEGGEEGRRGGRTPRPLTPNGHLSSATLAYNGQLAALLRTPQPRAILAPNGGAILAHSRHLALCCGLQPSWRTTDSSRDTPTLNHQCTPRTLVPLLEPNLKPSWRTTDTCPSVGVTLAIGHHGTPRTLVVCWGLTNLKPSWSEWGTVQPAANDRRNFLHLSVFGHSSNTP